MELVCDKCEDTRYYGRTAMYEILEISEGLKQDINNWTNNWNISNSTLKDEMITFEDSAKYLIENHITTQEECIIILSRFPLNSPARIMFMKKLVNKFVFSNDSVISLPF